jgi:hypothetical protein
MPQRIFQIFIVFFLFTVLANKILAQPIWSIQLLDSTEKKPAKFEEFQLGSEKGAEKKFGAYRRFMQNSITHYNYYYNANNKINGVVDKAKIAQKDDYSKLLSFYPYSLNNTALQKKDLDSVVLKCTAGILLHDLRNDWVDNMYLLLGEAYFYRKDFDSAAATFQFINYNLFPRGKDEDDNRVVGTNAAATNSAISIANPEKQNFIQKIVSQPPSRNDALVWLARTLVEQNDFGASAGLINTLQYDPNLPKRLRDVVEEVDAYWFFQQNIYDSTAPHLENALTNAKTSQDKARWEYLLAQLYEMTHQYDKASEYYEKVSKSTTDPLMDIYAQLDNAKMLKSSKPEELDKSINNLLHMAKQNRFETYRDILYYSAAQLAMQKPDTASAILYDNKSIHYNEKNISYRNLAFIQLGDIAFNQKDYRTAFAAYDSLQSGDTTIDSKRLAEIQSRRNILSKIVEKLNIIDREDSLQTIAAMAPADRDAFVKKLAKKLQKQKGVAVEEDNSGSTTDDPFAAQNKPADLFSDNSTKGEWYFYNSSLKTKGFNDFKVKWGKRADTDNWQRKSAVAAAQAAAPADQMPASMNPDAIDTTSTKKKEDATPAIQQPDDLSFVGLMSNLPLTPEKLNKSNALVAINLFELAKVYQDELQDYEQAIVTYNQSLARFPDSLYNGDIYLGLSFCYSKLGNTAKADYYKNLVNTKFAGSHAATVLNNPASLKPATKDPVVTKRYEDIYNLFIEGNFVEALAQKKKADSLYGNNYWSPQLLYIESIYDIKELCDDSVAKSTLKNLITLYPSSPMKPKAQRMIDVLNRRAAIEKYLTNLNVTRAKDDEVVKIDDEPVKKQITIVHSNGMDSSKKITPVIKPPVADTSKKIIPPAPITNGVYTFDSTVIHDVVMLLDKVDPTFVNEAKNAVDRYNAENFGSKKIVVAKNVFSSTQSLLVFSSFTNAQDALQYYAAIKKAAPDEISWLPASKYSFFIISDANMQLLNTTKDVTAYKKLLNAVYLNKF